MVPGQQGAGGVARARHDPCHPGQPRHLRGRCGPCRFSAQLVTGSVSTLTSGLSAVLRLARGRADGVVLVPGDRATIARSFWSIAFCLPPVIGRLLMSWAGTGVPADAAHLAGRELIVFVLGWLVFVEATY